MSDKFQDRPDAKLLWSKQKSVILAQKKLESHLFESTIEDAIGFWVIEVTNCQSFSPETIRNYQNYLLDLINRNILILKDANEQIYQTGQIAELYPEICKKLDACNDLSINEKKYRLNALIAFTQFLEDITNKKIQKIVAPLSFGLGSTDRKPAPLILNSRERHIIINEIKDISTRDYLVINLVMSTGRNLNKILKLKMSDLDLANSVVIFNEKEGNPIRINPGFTIIETLKHYLDTTQLERKDETVFITRAGKPVFRTHFQHILDQASEKAMLGFKVTLTMIQWSEVAESLIDHQSVEKVLDEFKLQSLPEFLETAVAGKYRK